MSRSPPRIAKILQIRRFDKPDKYISDLIIECFGRDKSCQKFYFNFKQIISQWLTSYFALFFLREEQSKKKYFGIGRIFTCNCAAIVSENQLEIISVLVHLKASAYDVSLRGTVQQSLAGTN